jgi:hypothetical protein
VRAVEAAGHFLELPQSEVGATVVVRARAAGGMLTPFAEY